MSITTDFVREIPADKRELFELSYTIYTDGSCKVKEGEGGWAAYIVDNKNKKYMLSGNAVNTTNNRMELTAILEAIQFVLAKLDDKSTTYATITVHCDSTYCTNTLREWIYTWVKQDFKNGESERPNTDLLRIAYKLLLICGSNLTFHWAPRNSNEQLTWCNKAANDERLKLEEARISDDEC